MRRSALDAVEAVCSEDQDEGDSGDGDFADRAYGEGLPSLFEEILEAGAEAYAGKGEEKSPAAEISEGGDLRAGEAVGDERGEVRIEPGVEGA